MRSEILWKLMWSDSDKHYWNKYHEQHSKDYRKWVITKQIINSTLNCSSTGQQELNQNVLYKSGTSRFSRFARKHYMPKRREIIADLLNPHKVLFPCVYLLCPKRNENDFSAQRKRARKGKWGSRQVEREPRYKVWPSSVESMPL